jgi:hypothetical protein
MPSNSFGPQLHEPPYSRLELFLGLADRLNNGIRDRRVALRACWALSIGKVERGCCGVFVATVGLLRSEGLGEAIVSSIRTDEASTFGGKNLNGLSGLGTDVPLP